ncbi:MAG TPA: dTDP-4-dehydrorhamnose 3,5-epimerase family protein [Chloroflexota bacterium]|nr:dTDP-4-dehydrorhamnose 3,5-epimerase family protein [Chloroflexota bacterium]
MREGASPYIIQTPIRGLFLIERPTFYDHRGFFREVERRSDLFDGFQQPVYHAQWNHSRSRRGVLRGIHVAAWNKCIYVVRGNAQVVVPDLRRDSETFGQHVSIVIGDRRPVAVFIPAGCGNSFLALSRYVDFIYSVDQEWYEGGEFGIAWNDADLAIQWKIREPVLSEKDRRNPTLREVFPDKFAASGASLARPARLALTLD